MPTTTRTANFFLWRSELYLNFFILRLRTFKGSVYSKEVLLSFSILFFRRCWLLLLLLILEKRAFWIILISFLGLTRAPSLTRLNRHNKKSNNKKTNNEQPQPQTKRTAVIKRRSRRRSRTSSEMWLALFVIKWLRWCGEKDDQRTTNKR